MFQIHTYTYKGTSGIHVGTQMTKVQKDRTVYLALWFLFVRIGCTGRVTERGTCTLSVGWVLHGILHNRYM